MKRVQVKRIFTADFRKSARTLFDEVKADRKLWRGRLGPDETYLFVSLTGNQLLFVLGDHEIESRPGTRFSTKRQLLDYRGWRIEGGTFEPHMLENYANSVGLTLGRATFEEYWAERYPTAS